MNKIKIRLIKIFTVATILTLVTGLAAPNFFKKDSSTVRAIVGDLSVDWGVLDVDHRIFDVNNMAPGDPPEEKSVDVKNNAASSRNVGVRGDKTSETGGLSTVLDIEILEGATTLYGPKKLDQFFTDSGGPDGIPLLTQAPGNTTTYKFKVTFPDSAGDEFQNTQVIFDLIIGISIELPAECDQIDLLPTPIIGTSKAENLTGTPGNDLIIGLDGADKIEGNSGDDCIFGGDGADKINGNSGNDVIFGEKGADTITGNEGNDFIDGGDGADTINGNNGNDTLIGGVAADTLRGENGEDHLIGGDAADTLDGGNDNDILEGNEGPDTLRGGNGNDNLDGGPGVDTDNGGPGTDTCVGIDTKTNCEL